MKLFSRHERSNPALGGLGAGIFLSMGAVSLAEVLSPAPRHTAVQVVVIAGFVVGAVLQYVGMAPRRAGGPSKP